MDNEAPNYATWIPEAGGYVANGKVVSRTPQYDANGKLVDVDVSQFPNTTPTKQKAQPQTANTLQGNAGVATANIVGSNTDANAPITGVGSLGSLAQNTQNAQDSALSTPATRSPSAGEPILTLEQQDLKEIQDAHARNDIQGEINGYVKLARDTGVDYSQTIQDLTRQRQDKIQGIDDNYLQRINEAQQRANNAKAMYELTGSDEDKQAYYQALDELNALQGEQTRWRNAVGYQDAMKSKYQQEMDDIDIDYDLTWRRFINDIGNQIIQSMPGILNFQYDPYNDINLQVAQQYAVSRVKEQMNATGMYYSSMTQGAMAKAVAELVPVYQKMAREEAIENFKLLQSTASFLMDLEATQFDMWKAQIQLKWDATNQKQKEIEAAINNANARGYYTNEEAAKVGVAPGTESQAARERALDKQEQIEAEIRNLQQNKALAEFKDELDREAYKEKMAIEAKYEKNTSSNNYLGLTYSQWKQYAKDYVANGGDANDIAQDLQGSGFSQTQIDSIVEGANTKQTTEPVTNNGEINWAATKLPGTMTASEMKTEMQQRAGETDLTNADKLNMLENAVMNGANWDDVWTAISTAQYESAGTKYNIFDTELLRKLNGTSAQKLEALDQYYSTIASGGNVLDIFDQLETDGAVAPNTKKLFVTTYIKDGLLNDTTLNSNINGNKESVNGALSIIGDNIQRFDKDQIVAAYDTLFDLIEGAGTKSNPFRYDKANLKADNVLTFWGKDFYDAALNGWGDKSKENAMLDVLEGLYTSNALKGHSDKTYILNKLTESFKERAKGFKNGYNVLQDDGKYYKFSK